MFLWCSAFWLFMLFGLVVSYVVTFISGIKFCMRLCIAFEAHALLNAENVPLFTV